MATRKSGGAKTVRTETVTVRLDPELRYLAEIAARVQRRTLSSYVEWAIIESLERVYVLQDTTITQMANRIWDVDEPDRFVKLALHAPDLLNYDEQVLWKVIREYPALWQGRRTRNDWESIISEASLNYQMLRKHWELLVKIAAGEASVGDLPKWSPPGFDGLDDSVPF